MLLNVFLHENNIDIEKKYLELCEKGIEIMKISVDINHDVNHIYEILQELDELLYKEKDLINKLDFNILLTAICWHDVWMSKRQQSLSIHKLIFERTIEGLGSALMLRKYLKDNDIIISKYIQIQRVIILHANYQFVPVIPRLAKLFIDRPLELKVLKDIDFVAGLNRKKIKRITGNYINRGDTDPLLFRIAYFYFKHFIVKRNPVFYFDTMRQKFDKEGQKIIRELVQIFNEIIQNKEYYFDTNDPGYKIIDDFEPKGEIRELIINYSSN